MEKAFSLPDLLRALRRRRRLAAAVFTVAFAVGLLATLLLPPQYRATSTVRVEPQRPAVEPVWSSVSQPVEERLGSLHQELFARPLLEQAIDRLGLFADLRERRGAEAAVERLAAMLDARIETPGALVFELVVSGEDPSVLAPIANLLPRLWAERTAQARARQARRAAELFGEELAAVSEQVRSSEARIGQFKSEHLGELPEQMEGNLRGLERTLADLAARGESRRELQRRLAELQRARGSSDSEVGRLGARELDLQRDLTAAQSQWAGGHPEVARLARELDDVRARWLLAQEEASRADRERMAVRSQIEALSGELRALEKQAALFQERLDRAPKWAHELAIMERDHEVLRAKYQSLLSRKVEAEIALALEEKAGAELLQVLSPATEPSVPVKPDRASAAALALLAALAAAVLVAVFAELYDDTVRDAGQVNDLGLLVLAEIPRVDART